MIKESSQILTKLTDTILMLVFLKHPWRPRTENWNSTPNFNIKWALYWRLYSPNKGSGISLPFSTVWQLVFTGGKKRIELKIVI